MLFLFGTRRTTVATTPLTGLACAHCHTPESLLCTVVSRYIHLFWIPVLPIGKASATVCTHCKQILTPRQMSPSYRAPVEALQQQARTPVTLFMVPALLGATLLISFVASLFKPKQAIEPTSITPAPAEMVGNRYKFNVSDDGQLYALLEVTHVAPDSVYYRMTDPLRGPLTAASAIAALQDSVAAANAQGTSLAQWNNSRTGQGLFKRVE